MRYSKKEVELIKDKYEPREGIYEDLADELDRNRESVRKKCRRMGMEPVRKTSQNEPKKAIVLPDMQVPFHDEETLSIVEEYMKDHEWDYYINLGDFMDFDFISDYNKRKIKLREGRRFEEDYEIGREILKRHRDIVGDDCEMYLIEGNHEDRVNRYVEQHPQFEGMVEVPKNLHLDELGIEWMPFWSEGDILEIGNAIFIHGKYTNKYHAKKHVNRYGKNIYYGHTHDLQVFSKVKHGHDKTLEGHSLGCLCQYDQQYKEGEPDNWQKAFATFHFFPDDFYNRYVTRIFKQRFIAPDGKVYEFK